MPSGMSYKIIRYINYLVIKFDSMALKILQFINFCYLIFNNWRNALKFTLLSLRNPIF